MKFLAVLFLAGFALAAAVPLRSENNDVDDHLALGDFYLDLASEADQSILENLKEKLNERIEATLRALQHALNLDDENMGALVMTFVAYQENLKEVGGHLTNKAKELLEKVKAKAQNYWQRVLDKIYNREEEVSQAEGNLDELKEKLTAKYVEMLEKLKTAFENREAIKEDALAKLKQVREKLRELGVDLHGKAKALFEKVKTDAIDYWNTLFDPSVESDFLYYADDEAKAEIDRRLRERYEQLLELLKNTIADGKVIQEITINKLKEIRQQIRERRVELTARAKDLLQTLRENAKDYWRKVLDKLTPNEEEVAHADDDENEDVRTELGKKLQERLTKLLIKLEDAIDHGKVVHEETLVKLKEYRQKLKEMHVKLSEKSKDLYEKIKEKAKDYWQKLLDKMNPSDDAAFADDTVEEIKQKTKKQIEQVLERMREFMEKGKGVSEDLLVKFKGLQEKLKDMHGELSKKAKEIYENLMDQGKDFWKRILDNLEEPEESKRSLSYADDENEDVRTELGKKLQERLTKMLIKLEDAIDHGKVVHEETLVKLKELRQKLKETHVQLSEKAKDLYQKIKEKAKDYWQKVLAKLNPDEEAAFADDDENEDVRTELGKKLQERLTKMLIKLEDAIEHGKVVHEENLVKLKELRQKLKEMHVQLSEKAKDLYQKIKEKAKDYWKKVLDKLNPDGEAAFADDTFEDLKERLRQQYLRALSKLADAIEKGQVVKEELLVKVRNLGEKLRDLKAEYGDKAKAIFEDLKNNAGNYFEKLLETITPNEFDIYAAEETKTELGKKLRVKLDEILDIIKEAVDQGKDLRASYLEKFKEIKGKLKELKVDFTDHAKQVMADLKEKGKNYLKKLFEKLKPEDNFYFADNDELKTELAKKLKKNFDEILEKVQEAIENGKVIKADTIEKLKEIRGKLKEMKDDITSHAKELISQLKVKAKDYWNQMLSKLGGKDKRSSEPKTELGKTLQREFEDLLQILKDAIEQGKSVKESYIEKLKEVRQQLKDLKVEVSQRGKELLEKLKVKARDYWNKLLDRIKIETPMQSEINFFDLFKRLKEIVRSSINAEELKAKVEKMFGKGSEVAEQMINTLKKHGDKGKQKILDFIDKMLPDEETQSSVAEVVERLKSYFKDLHIDLKENFAKFGDWVKRQYAKGLGEGKTQLENVKAIAKQFLEDTKKMSKDVADEALDFFREYKDDLKGVWKDVKEKAIRIKNGEE